MYVLFVTCFCWSLIHIPYGSEFLNDFFKPITSDMDRLKSTKKHRHGRRTKQLEKFEQKMKEERQKRIRERQKEFFSEIESHKCVFFCFSLMGLFIVVIFRSFMWFSFIHLIWYHGDYNSLHAFHLQGETGGLLQS